MDDSKTARDFLWCGEESFGEKNYLVAVENFEKAAKLGDADAMEKLADMYIYGIGVDRDIAKAVKYLEQAADIFYNDELNFSSGKCIETYVQAAYFGSNYACDKVAEIYLECLTAEENELLSSWDSLGKYQFFAESSEAMEKSSDRYLEPDFGDCVQIYERQGKYGDKYKLSGIQAYFGCMAYAARLGNAKAMAELAFMYREGLVCSDIKYREGVGIHKDKNKSDRWYAIAARCFERVADFLLEGKLCLEKIQSTDIVFDTCYWMCQLAEINLLGDTSEQDGYKAIDWYMKVVKIRNSDELSEDALKKLAEIYRDGKGGVIPEGKQAINLFTRVYKSGDKSALTEIAKICRDGLGGVIPDGNKAIRLFTKFYESGDKSALIEIAKIYRDGLGDVVPDGNKAIELFTKLYESGDESALHYIAAIYSNGLGGVIPDGNKAIELLTKLYESGDESAIYNIAEIYRDGLGGVVPDGNKAVELFTKTSNLNALAEIYVEGKAGVAPDGYKAIEFLTQIADTKKNRLGYGKIIEKIAEIYVEGKAGVAPDGYKAIEFLTQVTDPEKDIFSYRTAMKKIASIYKFGRGNVEKNIGLAIEWLEKAGCFSEIAEMYRDGVDVKQDSMKAVQYFTKAAKLGDTDAMRELAKIYKNGVGGVEKNEALATEWLENSRNIIEIAEMYRDGVEVKRNGAKAIEYFTKAAALGDTYAMKELAKIYRHGLDNIEKNFEKSNEWILKMNDLEPYGIF